MQVAIRERENTVAVVDRPMPLIDIGPERVKELITSITGNNEDAYQDVCIAMLKNGCRTEEDILQLAIATKKSTMRLHHYSELSLDKPLRNDNGGQPRTLLDVIPSPELHPSNPPKKAKAPSNTYLSRQGMDEDVAKLLRQKYPEVSLRYALRLALGLPSIPTKEWKPEEVAILKDRFANRSIESLSIKLERSITAVRQKGSELGLKRDKGLRHIPDGCYLTNEVMHIFSFSRKHLDHIKALDYLPGVTYKRAIIFHKDDIVSFIRNHPFEYRHDLLSVQWQHYTPPSVLAWLTIDQATSGIFYESTKIRRMIQRQDIPIKHYCPHTHSVTYVLLEHIHLALKLENDPLPYQVAQLGEKTHYTFWEDGDYLVRPCGTHQKGLPRRTMDEYNLNPFVNTPPTCLKCLGILRSHIAQIERRATTIRVDSQFEEHG